MLERDRKEAILGEGEKDRGKEEVLEQPFRRK